MKIILIGFMGSGKSSVAKRLGSLLHLPVLEMDDLVLSRTNTKDMHEVFKAGGELLLRETEIAIAREYALEDNIVISTGGGVVLNKIVLDYLAMGHGKIFFLDASFATITARVAGDDTSRPLFSRRAEAEALYHFRLPLYLKYAEHVIAVDHKSVEDIAREIKSLFLSCSFTKF